MRICLLFCITTVTVAALPQQQMVIPQKIKVPEAKKSNIFQQQVVIRPKQTKNQHQNVFKSIAPNTHPERNRFIIEVGTSDCRKAGSNAEFTFWFTGGHMTEGIFGFNRNSSVLGPFVFNSLKLAAVDRVRSDHVGGNFASIEQTMSLMIIKKTRTSARRAFADDWKPEFVTAHWRNSRGDSHTQQFVFSRHCSSDWLVENDYYVVNHRGLISQIMDSDNLDITDILSLPHLVY